jgi:hypothetical protein
MNDDRYERLSLIDWLSRDALSAMRVAVVGAGAVGNEVIKNLALFGVGALDIYDFDTIERHNLTRSVLFREGDVGRRKAECAAERGAELDANVRLRAIHGDVWRTLRLRDIGGYDAVVSCVDSLEARMRLNRMCRLAGVDFVNTGIDSRYAAADLSPFRTAPGCACFECSLPGAAYKAIAVRYSCGWLPRRAFVEGKIPTTILTASMSAAVAVSAVVRLGSPETQARQTSIDSISGRMTSVVPERRADCVGCGWVTGPVEIVAMDSVDGLTRLCRSHPPHTAAFVSDPLIVSGRCVRCDYRLDASDGAALRRAADYDDQLALCPHCREASMEIDIRDQFTVGELAAWLPQGVPAKFLVLKGADSTLVVDLEALPAGGSSTACSVEETES